jgi:hypothetical protein
MRGEIWGAAGTLLLVLRLLTSTSCMGWGYAIATEAQSVRKTPGRLRSRAWALGTGNLSVDRICQFLVRNDY